MAAFNQATWLAKRALELRGMGVVEPDAVALPGARRPIPTDMLHAHQALGRDQHDIAARVNAEWRAEHAQELAAHDRWATGPYHDAIVELQRRDQEARAVELRRQAAFEQLAREHA